MKQPSLCFETRHTKTGEVIIRRSGPVLVSCGSLVMRATLKQVYDEQPEFESTESRCVIRGVTDWREEA